MNKPTKEIFNLTYFTSCFPSLTQTFIYREVAELRKLGVKINTFSIHRPPKDMLSEEAKSLVDNTFYIFPVILHKFLWAHLYYLFKKPITYIRILFFVLTRRNTRPKDRIRTFYHFCEAIYMAKRIEEDKIKHIHVHFISGPATVAMIISKLLGISFSLTAHGSDLLVEKVLLKEKITLAKFIVAISDYNRNCLINVVPESKGKIYVVHCGVDPSLFQPSPKESDEKIILSVGSLRWQKAHSFLIEACRILKEKSIQFRCIIVGEGPERSKLEQLICQYGLNNFVELKGAVFQEEIQSYYSQADMFVLPSISEGIPVSLMEAMSKEVPVITTRITGIPELVEHMKTGLLVSPKDAKQLSDAISILINSDKLREKLSKAGREKIMQDFNIRKNILELKSLYESNICMGARK